MIRYTLSAIIISSLLFLAACGNLVNDELSADDQDQRDVIPGSTGFGEIIGNNFSTSGKVRIQSASDEGYFISSTIIGDSGRDELWLSYTDKKANRKWSATLKNTTTNDRISRIETVDKDNILIFADRYYFDPAAPAVSTDADLIIIKVNSSSGIVWQKCLGSLDKNIVYSTLITDDGGMLAAGISVVAAEEGSSPAYEYRPYVIRISSDGDIIWKKDYKIYLNAAQKKHFETIRPLDITSLGNEEYLISGTAVIPSNNKLATFYCVIDGRAEGTSDDGTPFGGGMILRSTYIKAGEDTVTLLGNISYTGSLVSIISIAGSSDTAKYSILIMDKETLKVTSTKNYEFESFRVQSGIIKHASGDFTIGGMIKPSSGKGIYTITFNRYGIIKDLHTRYYNNIPQDFITVEFNNIFEDSGLAYIIRLSSTGLNKEIFIDNYTAPAVSKSIIQKAEVIVIIDDPNIQEVDSGGEYDNSALVENADPGLLFSRY